MNNAPSWDCTSATTVKMPVTTWVVRTSNVRWNGWFAIGTVRLDESQANTGRRKLTVDPDAGERAPKICGDTDFPPYANRIKERTY